MLIKLPHRTMSLHTSDFCLPVTSRNARTSAHKQLTVLTFYIAVTHVSANQTSSRPPHLTAMAGKPRIEVKPKRVHFSDTVQTIPPLEEVDPNVGTVPRKPIPVSLRPGTPRKPPALEPAKHELHSGASKASDNRRVPNTVTGTQHRTPGVLNIRPPRPPFKPSHGPPARAPPAAPIPRKPAPAQTKKEPDQPLRRASQRIPPRPHLAPPKPHQETPKESQTSRQRQRSLGMIPDEQYKIIPKSPQAQAAAARKLTERELEHLVQPEDSTSVCEWYQTMSPEQRSAATHALLDDGKDKNHPDVLSYNRNGRIQSLWLIQARHGQQRREPTASRIERWLDGVEEVGEQK